MSRFSFMRFKKLRFYFAWPFAILLSFVAKTTMLGFAVGIPIIAAGEFLRIWSQGSIHKRVRLANSGPYAYMRNPLYLSNFLIGLGFVMIFSNVWILLSYLAGFFILYRGTILEEENVLGEQYGNLYRDYCSKVPRFFPTLRPYGDRSKDPFEFNLIFQHGEHITFLTILFLLLGLYLRQEWYQTGSGFYSSHPNLFWFAITIFVALFACMIYRKFK